MLEGEKNYSFWGLEHFSQAPICGTAVCRWPGRVWRVSSALSLSLLEGITRTYDPGHPFCQALLPFLLPILVVLRKSEWCPHAAVDFTQKIIHPSLEIIFMLELMLSIILGGIDFPTFENQHLGSQSVQGMVTQGWGAGLWWTARAMSDLVGFEISPQATFFSSGSPC